MSRQHTPRHSTWFVHTHGNQREEEEEEEEERHVMCSLMLTLSYTRRYALR